MKPEPAQPVKYFIGALYSSKKILDEAIKILEAQLSPVDYESEPFPFRNTDYYDSEMGIPIHRKFYSFTDPVSPGFLAEAKLVTNKTEILLAISGQRKVNLDIGYMDYDKVVLASAKYGIHKIYLNNGIYADMALHYEKGQFTPYHWAFMDFRSPEYYPFFLKIRSLYKSQVKHLVSPG